MSPCTRMWRGYSRLFITNELVWCTKVLLLCMIMPGPILTTGVVTDFDVMVWLLCNTLTKSHSLLPVISISLDPVRSTWLARDLEHMPTWSKLSPPCYRHLTPISYTRGCKPHYHSGTNAWMLPEHAVRSDVYNPLQTCHVYIRDWIRFLMSENLLTHVLKILLISNLMLNLTFRVVCCLQKLSQTAPVSAMPQMWRRHIQHQPKGEDDCKIWRFHFAEPLC